MQKKILIYLCYTFLLSSTVLSCIFVSTKVNPLDKNKVQESKTFVIKSPTKAHLYNGSVIVFTNGFEKKGDILAGYGRRFDLTRKTRSLVKEVHLDSVVSLEYYTKHWDADAFFVSIPSAIVGSVAVFKAIFGSCPTVYSFDGERYFLEAENFSYSIAERFEDDDLDRLDFGKVINGEYSLKVANEALETHYINNISILTVDHPVDYEAFPTEKHNIVLFGKENKILEAKSRTGDNVTKFISARDNHWYRSDSLMVKELTRSVKQDWIDLKVNIPEGAQKMYTALRLRNTLLNTVLLYDVMLQSQGIEAINWLGSDTKNPFYARRLRNWYNKHFGLNILLFNGRKYENIAHIKDTGPIAWHQVATELPVPRSDTAQLRFAFLPDNWMIDWIGVSFDGTENYQKSNIECSDIADFNGNRRNNLIALIKEKDERYFITNPGESYFLKFRVGTVQKGQKRTYFVKSRGYYIEWLRKEWLMQDMAHKEKVELEFNDETIIKTAQIWLAKKHRFENEFFESKISSKGGGNR